MKPIPEQEIRKILSELPPEDVDTVVTLVKSICQKRGAEMAPKDPDMSDEDHARLLSALDAVAALSVEKGPAVSNREHDDYLYGR